MFKNIAVVKISSNYYLKCILKRKSIFTCLFLINMSFRHFIIICHHCLLHSLFVCLPISPPVRPLIYLIVQKAINRNPFSGFFRFGLSTLFMLIFLGLFSGSMSSWKMSECISFWASKHLYRTTELRHLFENRHKYFFFLLTIAVKNK